MKLFVITKEEMIDGEVNINVEVATKYEKAKKYFNDEIENFKNDSIAKNHYEKEDFEEEEKYETSYFVKSNCDDYYFQIDIEEKETID